MISTMIQLVNKPFDLTVETSGAWNVYNHGYSPQTVYLILSAIPDGTFDGIVEVAIGTQSVQATANQPCTATLLVVISPQDGVLLSFNCPDVGTTGQACRVTAAVIGASGVTIGSTVNDFVLSLGRQ